MQIAILACLVVDPHGRPSASWIKDNAGTLVFGENALALRGAQAWKNTPLSIWTIIQLSGIIRHNLLRHTPMLAENIDDVPRSILEVVISIGKELLQSLVDRDCPVMLSLFLCAFGLAALSWSTARTLRLFRHTRYAETAVGWSILWTCSLIIAYAALWSLGYEMFSASLGAVMTGLGLGFLLEMSQRLSIRELKRRPAAILSTVTMLLTLWWLLGAPPRIAHPHDSRMPTVVFRAA